MPEKHIAAFSAKRALRFFKQTGRKPTPEQRRIFEILDGRPVYHAMQGPQGPGWYAETKSGLPMPVDPAMCLNIPKKSFVCAQTPAGWVPAFPTIQRAKAHIEKITGADGSARVQVFSGIYKEVRHWAIVPGNPGNCPAVTLGETPAAPLLWDPRNDVPVELKQVW